MTVGRKMDAAWKKAISDAKKKGSAVKKAVGNSIIGVGTGMQKASLARPSRKGAAVGAIVGTIGGGAMGAGLGAAIGSMAGRNKAEKALMGVGTKISKYGAKIKKK